MDEKNLALLAELKKSFAAPESITNVGADIKATSLLKLPATMKPRVLDLPPKVPQQSVVEKPSQHKTVHKKNDKSQPKRVVSKSAAKKPTKSKKEQQVLGPVHTLICNLNLTNKSKIAPAKQHLDFNSSAVFAPSFNAKYKFELPTWFHDGKNLQHPELQELRSRPVTVRIGIDFGTAFTKVAVKVGSNLLVVDWSALTGEKTAHSRNLLPGIVAQNESGSYCWENFLNHTLLTNLKLPLLNLIQQDKCPSASIAYLALVIRYTRAFIYQHPDFSGMLTQRSIRWELNIGCATEPFNKTEIVQQLQQVGLVAWNLAAYSELAESQITQLWQQEQLGLNGLEAQPEVTPEFVAQIAGYIVSPQLNDGLHLLIDVGAATIDVATFNVVSDRENHSVNIPIFCSKVEKLGTHFLQLHRHNRLELKPSWDDTLPIANSVDFARAKKCELSRVIAVDADYQTHVVDTICSILERTKSWRDAGSSSSEWKNGLPVFLTGGGIQNELFKDSIDQAESKFKTKRNDLQVSHFRFIPYSSMNQLPQGQKQVLDGRLTVAIGLTEDAASIARITPTRDLSALKRCEITRIDHADIYAK